MALSKPSLFRAILSTIEIQGNVENGKKRNRSQYSVQLSVADTVVATSTHPKPRSSVLKWEWNADNEISFEPSSMIKVVLYRGFGTNINLFNGFVVQYEGKVEDLLDNNASFTLTDKKGNRAAARMKISLSPVSTLTTMSVLSGNLAPHDNDYLAIGGLPDGAVDPKTRAQKAKAVGSVVYAGFKTVVEGLYDCSDMFLPLKTVAGGILTIIKLVETVLENKKELEDLKAKLEAILLIVKKYKKHNGLRVLGHRIEMFCSAITLQMKSVEEMQTRSLLTRGAEGTKDVDTILKAFRNISSLCDVFQIDTQLNIEEMVGDILQRLNSGSIEKLNHEMTSYKTRQSSYGDTTGCLQGTRVKVLEELDSWASDADSSQVYWMVGMAGIGKSTIAHTFCEMLEAKNMLGGNFFASRASEKTWNARLIIPVIAHALARASPLIKVEIVKAIEGDPTLAEPTYSKINEQFTQLVYNPIRKTAGTVDKLYKVVVIDAIDECVDHRVVSAFIKLVLGSASEIPLKVFISSRDESPIRNAFSSGDNRAKNFYLHEIENDVVQADIRKYLETSLVRIRKEDPRSTAEEWPLQSELDGLIARSGTLFIYAATAVRYIDDFHGLYKSRLSAIVSQSQKSISKFETDIDSLYVHILEKVCEGKEPDEAAFIRDLLSIVIFLRNSLPIEAVVHLSKRDALLYLSPLTSVIHIPKQPEAVVAPFHASFPDFITNPNRCSPERCPSFRSLVASEGHELLARKCLELMNESLKYNICEISKDLTMSRAERKNSLENVGKISEALKYACLYWAAHLSEVALFDTVLVDALRVFLHKHLLHWIEILSTLGELQTGLKSLGSTVTVLSTFKYHDLQLFVEDARRFLQMNFEAVRKHCMEIYQSGLVWIPNESLIRKTYITDVDRVPKVTVGLPNLWGATEFVIQNGSQVNSVAFSQDGSRAVSGSYDKIVRIWNVTTGEAEAELEGHTHSVRSVGFSPDGSRVVSGSDDKTVRIWNVRTAEVEAELEGHTHSVRSVAFSQDGAQVVSGSDDRTVRIWNVGTGKVEAELKGHRGFVRSVAFSPDGSRVVSGSFDQMVRIWNVRTGEVETELEGHTHSVTSVAFSKSGSRVASGSFDKTVRIWNVRTGKVEAKLEGHTRSVMSVAFSQDSSRVVSGSDDSTVRIWHVRMGTVEGELKGHTDSVPSVAFSQDGTQVVSGSDDRTVRIWNARTGEVKANLKGHTLSVRSVAFSHDGTHVVSGSDDRTVRIWNVRTGKMEAELEGHTRSVSSAEFSPDGTQVVSGSDDQTIRLWNVTTGDSQLMTGRRIILPDGGEVKRTGASGFCITNPLQQSAPIMNSAVQISDYYSQWIVGTLHDCWIPSHYRDFSSSSHWGSRICFGYPSGNVVILDMNVVPYIEEGRHAYTSSLGSEVGVVRSAAQKPASSPGRRGAMEMPAGDPPVEHLRRSYST